MSKLLFIQFVIYSNDQILQLKTNEIMNNEPPTNLDETSDSNESSLVLKLRDKASNRMLDLLDNPPEPSEFLKKNKKNYYKSIKTI